MTTTPLDLTELRKTAEAATEGPWDYENLTSTDARDLIGPFAVYGLEVTDQGDHPGIAGYPDDDISHDDARHIAAFDPPTVLALLDRVDLWEDRAGEAVAKYLDASASAEAAEAQVARVRELCMDTDGNYLDPEDECNNVGGILQALDGVA